MSRGSRPGAKQSLENTCCVEIIFLFSLPPLECAVHGEGSRDRGEGGGKASPIVCVLMTDGHKQGDHKH